MKGYLLFDNEETRENFLPMVWETVKCSGNEIEIPKGAKCLTIFPDSIITCPEASVAKIVIPRPKVKVKKTVEVSLYKDASARWKIPASIDTDKLPNYLGTFTVEIEVEE